MVAWDKATEPQPEERREIGVLKAVGWETSDVLAMKFWEGSSISLTAFLEACSRPTSTCSFPRPRSSSRS